MTLVTKIVTKINRGYKHAWNEARGINWLQTRLDKNAGRSRIVSYHGICLENHLKFNNIFLQLKTFETHLQFYKKYFHVVSLDDYFAKRFRNDKFNICINFDDGFSNNYKYALPLLKQYRVPAAFFITAIRNAGYDFLWNDFLSIITRYGPQKILYRNEAFYKDRYGKYVSRQNHKSLAEIIRSGDFDSKLEMIKLLSPIASFRENKKEEDFWLQMTQAQIKELAAFELCTIGSHGYYHNDLARLSIESAKEEIVNSKKYLEDITGKEIKTFAFPYGTYSRQVVEETKKSGFTQLLALQFHFPEDYSDTAMRERLIVNPYISVINQMHAIISGKHE